MRHLLLVRKNKRNVFFLIVSSLSESSWLNLTQRWLECVDLHLKLGSLLTSVTYIGLSPEEMGVVLLLGDAAYMCCVARFLNPDEVIWNL